MTSFSRIVTAGVLCLALGACGTLEKVNPFHKTGPKIAAAKGERIPVLSFDQTVKPADALAGVGFQYPAATPVAAWPLPGGTPEQAVENVDAAPLLAVAWKRDVGEGSARKSEVTAPPVAVDGKIFTLDGEAGVTATDAKSGARVWHVNLKPKSKRDKEAFGGGLAVSEGKVYVTSGFRFIAALDASDGKTVWHKTVEAPIHGAPTVANGRVYAVDVDNQIVAFDIATGEQSWSYQAIVESARILKSSSPAISGEQIVAPFSSGELVSLRTNNGNVLWEDSLSRASRTNALSEIRDIPGRPVIYRGEVYAASQSGVFAAVDLRSGATRWELPIASVNTPWAAGDVVYVVSKAGEVIAINRDSGQVYWVSDLNKNRVRKEGGFARMGRHEVRPIWTGPILSGDRLLLVNNWGELVSLDAHTGAENKSIKIGDGAFISPIAYDGMIYVMSDDANLIAIK